MTREFLKDLNLDEETINKVMQEHGRGINAEKAKFADYDDIKKQLLDANAKIESFGDVEAIKADVEKYKADAAAARKESEEKLAKMERENKVKDFTSSKKFVNSLTREMVNTKLAAALESKDAAGKSLEDIFAEVTSGLENILVDENAPKPPVVPHLNGDGGKDEDGVTAAFLRMNPGLKI